MEDLLVFWDHCVVQFCFLVDAKNEFPNKKLKRNVTQTPSMLMFSEVARKSKLSKTIQVNITGKIYMAKNKHCYPETTSKLIKPSSD